jgi:mRNA interferase RelE/StbE
MEQRFTLSYHYLVVEKDIPRLSREWGVRIKRAIEEKLTIHPDIFGKPLRRSLAGYRKLRVDDHRVIFRLEHTEVKIIVIAHRRDAYRFLEKRI